MLFTEKWKNRCCKLALAVSRMKSTVHVPSLEAAFIEFQSVEFTGFRAVLYLPTKSGITPFPVLMNTASYIMRRGKLQ